MSKQTIETVTTLITPILEERALQLFDIEFVKEGNDYFLRIFIDKESGVDLTECGIVSERVSEVLDKADPIKQAYFLEVSSPGAERPLRSKADFETYVDENIYVSLYAPIEGSKEYEGLLKQFEDDVVTIEYKLKTRVKEVDIPFNKIANARLSVML